MSSKGDNTKLWQLVTLPMCAILAVLFFVIGKASTSPLKETQPLNVAWYSLTTARGELVKNAPIVGNCWICHAMWVKPPDPFLIRPKFAHPEVRLNHGRNERCFNCHLITNRSRWTSDDQFTGILHTNVEELCGRCHGVIYKDWLEGTHGLRRGKWNAQGAFDRENVKCNECHDPHAPIFKFTEIAPPPRWMSKFIRSGAPDYGEGHLSEIVQKQ